MRYQDKVVIVTGGSKGIGLGCVKIFVAEGGSRVVFCSRNESEGRAVEADVNALGPGSAHFVRADMSKVDDIRRMIDTTADRFGRIDCLVNNAGIASPVRGDLLELTPENYDRVLAVNLRGTLFFTQAVAKRMLAQAQDGARSIITVSSINADMAAVERGDYAISKTGLAMLTKLFALRLAAAGIGVFEVRPGIIRTDMTAIVSARYDRMIAEGVVPMRRWGEPGDVAAAVAALADDAFNFATGSVIEVAGGLAIPRL
jgi:NAD(P)-dependent dehydrogenase (short-subunit alcohol dehydrogenase family)